MRRHWSSSNDDGDGGESWSCSSPYNGSTGIRTGGGELGGDMAWGEVEALVTYHYHKGLTESNVKKHINWSSAYTEGKKKEPSITR